MCARLREGVSFELSEMASYRGVSRMDPLSLRGLLMARENENTHDGRGHCFD